MNWTDPLLYAAKKAIGPKQLIEEEARDTARRAYAGNSSLSSLNIGKAIGRARQTVDVYIADLSAATQQNKDIKIFSMNRLGIPQDRIAKRLGMDQKTVYNHLGKMPVLANLLNTDLPQGFTVAQVSQKHAWTEPMVWSLALEDRSNRPEIEPHTWMHSKDQGLSWPVRSKTKPETLELSSKAYFVPDRKPRVWAARRGAMLTKLPIYKAQKILKPECTTVHEDFKILQQRSRWVSFRSNTILKFTGSGRSREKPWTKEKHW